jgi:hypothetical protein
MLPKPTDSQAKKQPELKCHSPLPKTLNSVSEHFEAAFSAFTQG